MNERDGNLLKEIGWIKILKGSRTLRTWKSDSVDLFFVRGDFTLFFVLKILEKDKKSLEVVNFYRIDLDFYDRKLGVNGKSFFFVGDSFIFEGSILESLETGNGLL